MSIQEVIACENKNAAKLFRGRDGVHVFYQFPYPIMKYFDNLMLATDTVNMHRPYMHDDRPWPSYLNMDNLTVR